MAEYLVRISLRVPPALNEESRASLLAAERAVGLDYRKRGVIQRIWRKPGTTANVGVWCAADASELDRLLAELPAFRYMTIEVESLALHYLEIEE